jgi:hypothetical protein
MFQYLAILAAIASRRVNAFYIEIGDYDTTVPDGGGGFGLAQCTIYGADTQMDAINYMVANENKDSDVAVLPGVFDCGSIYDVTSTQLGGYWADRGWLNYDDGTTHWYCYLPSVEDGGCDAGAGQPSGGYIPRENKRSNRMGGADL